MNDKRAIPSRLFLAAGREVEAAFRAENARALSESVDEAGFIATSEGRRVVFLSADEAAAKLAALAAKEAAAADAATLAGWRAEYALRTLLRLVLRVARRIYLEQGEFYVEISSDEIELALFLRDEPELLREVGEAVVGHHVAAHVLIVGPGARRDPEALVSSDLLHLSFAFEQADDILRAQHVKQLEQARHSRMVEPAARHVRPNLPWRTVREEFCVPKFRE